MKNAHALDPSTQRNDHTIFCTLHVSATRVRRLVSHWVQEKNWNLRHDCLVNIDIIAHWIMCLSWTSGFSSFTGSDQAGNSTVLNFQKVARHESYFILVLLGCSSCFLCTHLYNHCIENFSTRSGPKHQFLRNIRTLVEHVTFVTIQHRDSTLPRVFSNRQQWFTHRCLNTSNSEIRSPIVATRNIHSFATFEKFSKCCAESEITLTKNPRPKHDNLTPYRISCTSVKPNLDPLRFLYLLKLLNRSNFEVSQTEFIKFNFWFCKSWFRVKIETSAFLGSCFPFEQLLRFLSN